ncbi:hypothetical protein [Azospirillum sp. sgz302134]
MPRAIAALAAALSLMGIASAADAQQWSSRAPTAAPGWLPRVEAEHRDGYNSGAWGGWEQLSKCSSMRDQLLAQTSEVPAVFSPDRCTVIAGRWTDPYTGASLTNPADIDIDHIVSIQEMHGSGGWRWSPAAKKAAYNDTYNVAVVAKRVIDAKGGKDIAGWQPSNNAARCAYVERYLAVKRKYDLAVDPREARTLQALVTSCGNTSSIAEGPSR